MNKLRQIFRGMLNGRFLLGVTLVPIALGGAGTIWHQNHGRNVRDAYLTATVERGDVEDTISALGTVQPREFVDVGTQVTGQLKVLHIKIGSEVKKGDLIAEIDPVLFTSRVEMAEASLQQALAQLHEKQVQLRFSTLEYERNSSLYRKQAVSEEILQQSQASLDQATAQIDELNAQIRLAKAQLSGDQANLRYTKIYAPLSGTVVAINAREGQTLVSTQQAPIILRVADLNTMTVWAQVSEADVPRIAEHKPAFFSPIGLPDKRWYGEVRQILPTPESVNSVILYDVLFDVTNKAQLLKPQMTVQANFVIAHAENTLVVPVSALQSATKHHKDDGGHDAKNVALTGKKQKMDGDQPEDLAQSAKHYTVRVLTAGGEIEEREVVVGVMSRIKAEIISGLSQGDEVIIGTPDEGGKKTKSRQTTASTQS